MRISNNKDVSMFLEDMMNTDEKSFNIFQALREIVFNIDDRVEERIMYGGIMFTKNTDFGGIYANKKHVSFEFSNGAKFNDVEKILEGGGKFRRHLKIYSLGDVNDKQVEAFVKQAI